MLSGDAQRVLVKLCGGGITMGGMSPPIRRVDLLKSLRCTILVYVCEA